MTDPVRSDSAPRDPGYAGVRDFLLYTLSLPERAMRCGTGLAAGTLRESASLLVPQAFQNSKTYSVMVRQMLDFLAEDVGGVQPPAKPSGPPQVENFVARKAVGNFIDLASMATLHLSPMLLLAVASDVAYGSQAYLKELAGDLKSKGVIEQNSTIDHVDDLLRAVAAATETTATAFATPPLSVEGLKRTIDDTRAAVQTIDPSQMIPQAEVKRLWDEMHDLAAKEGVDPLAISGAITLYSLGKIGSLGRGALSTVTTACVLFDRHVLSHYAAAASHIRQKGFYASLAETSKPYIESVWSNFSTEKTTITEDLLTGKLAGRAWGAIRRWMGATG